MLTKPELGALADRLHAPGNTEAIAACVQFVVGSSRGLGHGRRRALMCRRLKHVALDAAQREELVACILQRLRAGDFGEQFRDQLRLALHLDAAAVRACLPWCASDGRVHMQRIVAYLERRLAVEDRLSYLKRRT
jgi:hypothetical protein